MSAFYTFLSSLYNFLLKFISLIILLGQVRTFLGEVLKISREVQSHPRCVPPPKIRPWFLYTGISKSLLQVFNSLFQTTAINSKKFTNFSKFHPQLNYIVQQVTLPIHKSPSYKLSLFNTSFSFV